MYLTNVSFPLCTRIFLIPEKITVKGEEFHNFSRMTKRCKCRLHQSDSGTEHKRVKNRIWGSKR